MSWKYRPFDGGYDDSLNGMVTFRDTNSMLKYCHRHSRLRYIDKNGDVIDLGYPFEIRDMYISDTTFDDSYINWKETRYIYVTSWYGENLSFPKIVGVCCPYNKSLKLKDIFFKFCRVLDKSPEEREKINKLRYEQLCDEYLFRI